VIQVQLKSTDAKPRRAVLETLCADPTIKTRAIDVDVQGGVVALSGWVTSNAQKAAVRAAVLRVAGIQTLTDTVRVAVPGLPGYEAGTPRNGGLLTLKSLSQAAPARQHVLA
jgi:hypothetical protein